MSTSWIPTRDIHQMENARHQRKVEGWQQRGSSYRNGRRIGGDVRLMLSEGGWLWYPEGTPLDTAFADADSRGFSTTEARAQLQHWVETGQGATFSLER